MQQSASPDLKQVQKLKVKMARSSDTSLKASARGALSSRSHVKKSVKIDTARNNASKSNKGSSPLKASVASSMHSRKQNNADLKKELQDDINVKRSAGSGKHSR